MAGSFRKEFESNNSKLKRLS